MHNQIALRGSRWGLMTEYFSLQTTTKKINQLNNTVQHFYQSLNATQTSFPIIDDDIASMQCFVDHDMPVHKSICMVCSPNTLIGNRVNAHFNNVCYISCWVKFMAETAFWYYIKYTVRKPQY
jgi:hypothetical protein